MTNVFPIECIESRIFLVRGQKVMLDSDLAALYQVPTGTLNQAVKRKRSRFPQDFMFRLTPQEYEASLRSQIVILDSGRGKYRKYLPHVFTEQGIAMLSSVLSSECAVQVNIEIMRVFVRLRQLLLNHAELAQKLAAMEHQYDAQFKIVFDAIRELMTPTLPPPKQRIGFAMEQK